MYFLGFRIAFGFFNGSQVVDALVMFKAEADGLSSNPLPNAHTLLNGGP